MLLTLFTIVLCNFRLLDYGWMQLQGQLAIVWNSRPVAEVLTDPSIPDSVKSKLRYIQEVEKFGVDSLGLKPTRNYRSFYDQHGKPLLWVVTASERYALKPYTWRFPLIGEVSYKGFFVHERADRLSNQLHAEGYDVDAYEVGAWSTLGWLSDPILSGMLRRDEGRLAELILHELTHATVYLKSNVDLNENLASFVGEEGAKRFLVAKFGAGSPQLISYLERLEDDNRLTHHLVLGATALRRLYESETFKSQAASRDSLKQLTIDSVVKAMDTLSFSNKSRFVKAFEGRSWNNAHFLSYLRYDARKDSLLEVMQRLDDGNIRRFVARIAN